MRSMVEGALLIAMDLWQFPSTTWRRGPAPRAGKE